MRHPTLKHILNGCYVFLKQGRYTWRHNNVLKDIHTGLEKKISNLHPAESSGVGLPYIQFVPEAQARRCQFNQPPLSQRRALRCGLLYEAHDWEILADGISPNYSIPLDVAVTNLRPDICLYSRLQRRVVLLELTVPMEDRLSDSALVKTNKYINLVNDITSNNWKCDFFSIEIGSRGNAAASLGRCLATLGFGRKERQELQRCACSTARKASYFIYLRRNEHSWGIPSG